VASLLSCGDTSPRGFRVGHGEGQCKGNRRGVRYEGQAGREAGREKQKAGPRFDPASAPLGARASRRIERGGRLAPIFFGMAEVMPFYKRGWLWGSLI
jgi:hypothetical protein